MEHRHLKYFRVVAEELNFTRAAERLHISQPPLSRQIKQLEDEVGAELLTRTPQGLKLTATGHFLYEQSLQILAKIDATLDAARRMARSKRVMFGIGFVPSVFYGQLPILVRELRQRDDVELTLAELTTVQQIQALKSGRIDLGFGRLEIEDADVEQESLFDEPLMAALPSGHALENSTPSLKDIAQDPLILFPAKPRPSMADFTLNLFRRRGLDVHVAYEANELQTALGLVASGIGIALVPEQVKRVQRDGIVYVYLEDRTLTCPVICSRRRNERPSAVMQEANAILDVLVENRRSGRYP